MTKKTHGVKKSENLESIKTFLKRKLSLFYQNIDFLTIQIGYSEIYDILNSFYRVCDLKIMSDKKYSFDYIKYSYSAFSFDEFIIVYNGLAFNNKKKVFGIYDCSKNKIGQIIIASETGKKDYHVIEQLELSGLFFHCYESYFDDFLNIFQIDKNKQNIVRRIDYCADFKGLEVFQMLKFVSEKVKKRPKYVNSLPATDKRKIMKDYTSQVNYGAKPTSFYIFGTRNDLKIYDKTLDVLDNRLKRLVHGKNPYSKYLNSDLPIFRIEIKKKYEGIKDLKDNSISYFLQNIKSLYWDYLKRYFVVDLSFFCDSVIPVDRTKKEKSIAQKLKSEKLFHALMMFQAYGETIKTISGDKYLKKKFVDYFPDTENFSYIDTISEDHLQAFEAGEVQNLQDDYFYYNNNLDYDYTNNQN